MNPPEESREELLDAFRRSYGLEDLPVQALNLALTHRSYAFEQDIDSDNERLEFLGDAIIAAITAEYLYETDMQADEGKLSKRRARLVSRTMLGRRAHQMGIGALMLLGRGERQSGGRRRRSILGSALEALVASVYLQGGYERAAQFARDHILEPLAEYLDDDDVHGDYKSALQEWTQRIDGSVPAYRVIEDSGPDHAKAFRVEVEVGERRLAQGTGPRIKQAENDAARRALERLRLEELSGPESSDH